MTRTIVLLASLMFWVGMCHVKAGNSEKLLCSIPGTTLKVIQIATPKFKKHGLSLERYVVHVYENDSSFLVEFADPNAPPRQFGSSPNLPEFNVEISKPGLKVIRSYFVR